MVSRSEKVVKRRVESSRKCGGRGNKLQNFARKCCIPTAASPNPGAKQDAFDALRARHCGWALDNDTNVNPQTGLQYEIGNQYAYQYVCSDETTVYQTDGTINPNGATPVTNWTDCRQNNCSFA